MGHGSIRSTSTATWWPVAAVRRSIVLTHATTCNPRATRSGGGGSGPDAKCCEISGEPNRNRAARSRARLDSSCQFRSSAAGWSATCPRPAGPLTRTRIPASGPGAAP
jgi:hypothetical protein